MRFTTLLLVAGSTAFSFAAPAAVNQQNHKRSPGTKPVTKFAGANSTGKNSTGLQWFGANESGAEFGNNKYFDGVLGTDYGWPNNSAIDVLMNDGMNIFRIPIMMERIVPTKMTGTIDATYLSGLMNVVNHITAANAFAIIDSQNFGRYAGQIFTSTSDFKTYWTTVATQFKNNSNVIFDCNNEFHDEPSNSLVANLNQACVDGVRAAGATDQYIFVEGTSYTGAWTWVSSGNSDSMLNITDPQDKIVYEMHQYLDLDGSGQSATCVNTTIGADRIAQATAWLKANKKKGIIGEYAGGANDVCKSAVTGMLDALVAANDVWMGALWWGAGPLWADYIYGMEPSSGKGYAYYIDTLKKYMPAASTNMTSTWKKAKVGRMG